VWIIPAKGSAYTALVQETCCNHTYIVFGRNNLLDTYPVDRLHIAEHLTRSAQERASFTVRNVACEPVVRNPAIFLRDFNRWSLLFAAE
jgi:hypothetical protein